MNKKINKTKPHYKETFEDHITAILNKEIHDKKCRSKTMSVLSYIIKYCKLNDGVFSKSYEDFHKMYQSWKGHPRMSLANFKKIILRLSDLELVFINKFKNKNVYCFDQKVAQKVAEKISALDPNYKGVKKVRTSEQSFKELSLYTNTLIEETLKYYQENYKGISGRNYASKKDLIDIAKTIMSMRSIHYSEVQAMVFRKIYTLQQKINIKGAVMYVNQIILEKYEEAKLVRDRLKDHFAEEERALEKRLGLC